MSALEVGLSSSREHVVGEEDTAAALGSGSLPVLGTPRLLAWCEAATCHALEGVLDEGSTSVGTRISLEHLAPSVVGAALIVSASVAHVDGRLVRFTVEARQAGKLAGAGEVTRVIVATDRFLSRL